MNEHIHRWKEAFINFIDHDGPVSAGNMAFLTMLSLFPFLIFLVALSGFLGAEGSVGIIRDHMVDLYFRHLIGGWQTIT